MEVCLYMCRCVYICIDVYRSMCLHSILRERETQTLILNSNSSQVTSSVPLNYLPYCPPLSAKGVLQAAIL